MYKHSDCSQRELCFTAGGEKATKGVCTKRTIMEVEELAQQTPLSFVEVEEHKVDAKGNVAGVGELKLSAPVGKSATLRLGRVVEKVIPLVQIVKGSSILDKVIKKVHI